MRTRVVIIGGGVGGLCVANRLARRRGLEVVLVDGHGDHLYQPGFLQLPLHPEGARDLVRATRPLLHPRAALRVARAAGVDPAARRVALEPGGDVAYDILVLATGSKNLRGAIPGLREGGHDFHCMRHAASLGRALAAFGGGDIVVGSARLPHKCPDAPIEFLLLLDEHLRRGGRRGAARLHLVHPEPTVGAGLPQALRFGALLAERGVEVHTTFRTAEVDPARREVVSARREALPYDLLVLVPPQTSAPFLTASGLADARGWVPVDPHTLRVRPGVFALGDAACLPVPKLGAAARLQAAVVAENVQAEARGRPPRAMYGGEALCLLETGRGQGVRLDWSARRPPRIFGPGRRYALQKRLLRRLYFQLVAR